MQGGKVRPVHERQHAWRQRHVHTVPLYHQCLVVAPRGAQVAERAPERRWGEVLGAAEQPQFKEHGENALTKLVADVVCNTRKWTWFSYMGNLWKRVRFIPEFNTVSLKSCSTTFILASFRCLLTSNSLLAMGDYSSPDMQISIFNMLVRKKYKTSYISELSGPILVIFIWKFSGEPLLSI